MWRSSSYGVIQCQHDGFHDGRHEWWSIDSYAWVQVGYEHLVSK
jgi:hypothetical protein